MGAAPIRPSGRAASDPAAAVAPEPAEVAAHTILLRRGTYCIHVVNTSAGVAAEQLPGLSVSAAPGEENTAVEIARLSGEPWLRQSGDAILVRVHTEQVRLLLTSYNTLRTRGATPPKVEVQRLGVGLGVVEAAPGATLEPSREITTDVMVHVRNRGDEKGSFGEWVGDRNEHSWIEGFTIAAPQGLQAGDIEYQAVFGKGWSSPWVKAGEYCGSRGLQLPILGLRVRLNNTLEERLDVSIEVAFADDTTFGPVGSGVVCAAEPLQPITAIKLAFSGRPDEAGQPEPASPSRRVVSRAGAAATARGGWRSGKK